MSGSGDATAGRAFDGLNQNLPVGRATRSGIEGARGSRDDNQGRREGRRRSAGEWRGKRRPGDRERSRAVAKRRKVRRNQPGEAGEREAIRRERLGKKPGRGCRGERKSPSRSLVAKGAGESGAQERVGVTAEVAEVQWTGRRKAGARRNWGNRGTGRGQWEVAEALSVDWA